MRDALGQPLGQTQFRPVRIGAGGFVTGVDVVGTTKICHTDVHNAYIWDDVLDEWRPLVTSATMPAGVIPLGATYNQWLPNSGGDGPGVWYAVAAPSNPNRIYMHYYGRIWVSTNAGLSFTQCVGFGTITGKANAQSFAPTGERLMGPKMAVDPQNENHVWVCGHEGAGTWYSTDGGATATQVPSGTVPHPVDGDGTVGPHVVLIDETSPVVSGRKQVIYLGVVNVGFYRSADGGASWTLINGPTVFRTASMDSTGRVIVGDHSGNFNRYTHGSGWTQTAVVAGQIIVCVAQNPTNANHLVAIANFFAIYQSFNGGTSWSAWNIADRRSATAAGDVPWLAVTANNDGVSQANCQFDSNGVLWVANGIGVYYIDSFPTVTTTPFVAKFQSRGIELLCVRQMIKPPGGDLMTVNLDRGVMRIPRGEPFPVTYGPSLGLTDAYHIAYSPFDPKYLVWCNSKNGKWHGFSTDGGLTLNVFPNVADLTLLAGGAIAVSEPGNIVFVPSSNAPVRYSEDGGVTWGSITLPGYSDAMPEKGFGFAQFGLAEGVVADSMTPGVFYCYNYGPASTAIKQGIYRSDNKGKDWALVFDYAASPLPALANNWQFATFHPKLYAVPGQAGHLFFTPGRDTDGGVWRCSNGLTNSQTWTEVTGTYNGTPAVFSGCYALAFGKAPQGQSYPSIGVLGRLNNQFGVWVSNDNCQTWRLISGNPINNIEQPLNICGDMGEYDAWYVSFGCSACAGAKYDYTMRLS